MRSLFNITHALDLYFARVHKDYTRLQRIVTSTEIRHQMWATQPSMLRDFAFLATQIPVRRIQKARKALTQVLGKLNYNSQAISVPRCVFIKPTYS